MSQFALFFFFFKIDSGLCLSSLAAAISSCLEKCLHSTLCAPHLLKILTLGLPLFPPKLNFSVFDFPTPDFMLLRTGSETQNNALAFKPAPPLASKPTSLAKLSLCVQWCWGVVWGSGKGCVHICIWGWNNKMDNWILNGSFSKTKIPKYEGKINGLSFI